MTIKISWTKEQSEAVFAPVSDILVTAAAGSGKTQVLTGRIIERIINGADITRLLVVTFTNAAASEMRARISKSLSDALRETPKNTHIREQLACLSGAHITTMHSFCMEIIKRNFYHAGISAGFRIADDTEATLLLMEAADEATEELYGEKDSAFLAFADSFSSIRSDSVLSELAISLYRFADSMPYPEKWLTEQISVYEMKSGRDFEESLICRTLLADAKRKLCEAAGILSAAKELCTDENKLSDYRKMFENDIEIVRRLIFACGDYEKLRNALSGFSFPRRSGAKEAPAELKDELGKIRDRAKKIVSDLYAANFSRSSDENALLMHRALPIVKGAAELVLRTGKIFAEKKRKRNIIDYSDMEHIAVSLLDNNGKPSEIAEELKNSFDEIYIDEYQDTGEIQELIFGLISKRIDGKPNVFMVGDLKQSIYGFRQANPELFAEKKKTYKPGDEKYRKISLTKNFRSSPAVIDFVNHVFSRLMSAETGGVEYDDEERLVAGAEYPEIPNAVEVAVVNLGEKESADDENGEDLTAIEAESLFIADKILSMVGKEYVFDAKRKEKRLMSFGDIAILSRSVKEKASLIEEVLFEKGIPVYSDSGGGYFETSEIKGMLSLLSAIDNPRNDIPLISAMRIPTIGFDEDILAGIRLHKKEGDFYDAVKSCSKTDTPEGKVCRDFLKKLNRWRFLSEHLPCDELIQLLYDETGYMDFALAMPGGEMRAANLRLLAERARVFEQTSYRGLFNFINFIDKMRDRGDTGPAKIIGEAHDVVRIMSIHKSKGLEFPVVFLANCGKKFNRRDETEKLTFHRKIGIGTDFFDTKLRSSCTTPIKAAIAAAKRADSVSEELRILYVALTRAKERLIITATTKKPADEIMAWKTGAHLAKSGGFASARSFLDWIGACLYSGNCPGLSDYCERKNGSGPEVLFDFYPVAESLPREAVINEKEEVAADFEELFSGLSFEYPHKNLARIPSKISVSEIKRLKSADEDEEFTYNSYMKTPIKRPRFIRESDDIIPTEAGSMVHFVMQTIPLPVQSPKDIENHVADLLSKRIISEKVAEAIPAGKIYAFFSSPLGQRVNLAEKVIREKAFTDYIDASYITKNKDDGGVKVLVQGIIDCFFFENDKIILIDYKTDKVKSVSDIVKNYKVQIETYASYLERKYLKKCEKYIYLFDIDDIIKL